nr:energy coupling factor transporter S component ThiW [Intestinimonas massiliensis (ex Afouda et al. 2020)]
MNHSKKILRMVFLAMMVAIGVVISPILRVEGMCPTAHLINIVCAVLMGPWYALLCAALIGIIRMSAMGIPPLALTGAVFGAFLSGVLYRASRGKLICAVLGEVAGTGIIGAIVSYPVMTLLVHREGLSWLFYVPSFLCGTLIGGSVAFVFLRQLARAGVLPRFQRMLSDRSFEEGSSPLSNAAAIAALGMIVYLVIKILTGMVFPTAGPLWNWAAWGAVLLFAAIALVYYLLQTRRKGAAARE